MADAKQDKKQEKNASSEGFGFKQSPLGFDKNEVNLYINKLKKQMKEMELDYEVRIDNMRKNLESAHDENRAAKAAAAKTVAVETDSVAIQREKEEMERTQKLVDDLKKANEAKIMELRKQILDERRNVAKLDKDCAMAQMSEKKIRAEYEKLKQKYSNVKKSGGGAQAVVTSNADEVLDEACKLAEQVVSAAKDYAAKAVSEVNAYKKKVEAELKTRSKKLSEAKKELDEQKKKAEADNESAQNGIKALAEKIAAVTGQLTSFSDSFNAVNTQISAVTGQIDAVTDQLGSFAESFTAVNEQIGTVTNEITAVTDTFSGVTKSINEATTKMNDVSQQFTSVSQKLSGSKDSFGSITEALESAKNGFSDITKTVDSTKESISAVKLGVDEAGKLVSSADSAATDISALDTVSSAIEAAAAEISIEVNIPDFDDSAFSKQKLEEIKSKLKIETTYEGVTEDDDDDDSDIISSLESFDEPALAVEENSGIDDIEAEPEAIDSIDSEPEAIDNIETAPEADDDMSSSADLDDMFVDLSADDDMSSSVPIINMEGVQIDESFTLDPVKENIDNFDITPNDMTAVPEKGMDLGDEISNMVINPVDSDDDTLNQMLIDAELEEAANSFELKPAEIDEDKIQKSNITNNDDFGEFADLFAAGSAETTAPDKPKKPAPFRKPASSSDDIWNLNSLGGDDTDMSADSDLSDLFI